MTKKTDVQEMTAADAGTWFSGAMGWHNGYRVVQSALSWGWEIPEEYRQDWNRFAATLDGEADHDLWCEANGDDGGLAEKATEHLQSLSPEGYVFVWDMGELSLIPEWQDCADNGDVDGCSVQYRSDNEGKGREVVIFCPDHNPCAGHNGEDADLTNSNVGVGETTYCDGSCQD